MRPSLDDLREARRALPLLAAVLFVAALAFPMWTIEVHAVQYPDTVLHLQLYAYPHIAGDYAEMARLNKYIGFYYPDPVYWQPNYLPKEYAVNVPEWSLGPLAFVGVAALSVFVAIAPTARKLRRGLTAQLAGTVVVFGVMLVDIQYRLYQTGHHLDPDAPVMGVEGFTPPLWGKYEVANITSYSRFGLGAYASMLAVGLLVVAVYYRDDPVTLGELPDRVRGGLGAINERARPGLDAVRERLPGGDGDRSPTVEEEDRSRPARTDDRTPRAGTDGRSPHAGTDDRTPRVEGGK